ncbi:hypothetical protein [Nitrosomonas sp.]|uniref:hypothetical protein n=1 Tax=Nitrosomonas sp. TaxID=42353 RepID=UPI0025EFF8FB|nr:hypothetical protein [Nitrosomonas sp.]MBV6448171.1 hypothetical protein [Nitrosomonas sp.]
MSYELPQKNNPRKIIINQHVFPAASISRFSDQKGFVSVFLLRNNRVIKKSPKNKFFCAKRVWNQPAEQGYMKNIENSFQELVDRILLGHRDFTSKENSQISHFYALWCLRYEAKNSPLPDISNSAMQESRVLSKDEEENLENNGYVFARGKKLPSRHLAAILIQVQIGRRCPPETEWAVIYSRNIKFIVPDNFGEIGIVPLTPNLCLVANADSGEIADENAIRINKLALEKSGSYYFAKNLEKCGL